MCATHVDDPISDDKALDDAVAPAGDELAVVRADPHAAHARGRGASVPLHQLGAQAVSLQRLEAGLAPADRVK